MRKIRRPNIAVKYREVFYQLKRNSLLEGLDEATIEEILTRENPGKLVNPGFIYENFESQILEERDELGTWPMGHPRDEGPWDGAFSAAVATIGDAGFEERIKNLTDSQSVNRVLWAWAQVLLTKLVDLATSLISEEASQDLSEPGPSLTLAASTHKKLLDFVASRLNPQEKLGIKLSLDPLDNTQKVFPALTKFWLVPWLTKKEKKQLIERV